MGQWEKKFTLVPKTQETGDLVVQFPVDASYFTQVTNLVRDETGLGAPAYNLIIEAQVRTRADTQFGSIDEVFTHTLTGALEGNIITWDEELWDEELSKSEPGTIESTRTVNKPGVSTYRTLSVILLIVVLLGSLFISWNIIRAKPVMSTIEVEAVQATKKYKNVIVDVSELPVTRPEETVITCGSLGEVIKIADNLFKPVLHQAEADQHTYCVIDGLIRYEYISKLQPADEA